MRSGIFAKPDQWGDVIYLQAKHFDDKGFVMPNVHPDLLMDGKVEKHLLSEGDILFAAKGYKNFAAVYYNSIGLSVASSTFLVLSLEQGGGNVVPEYVKWYLNRSDSMQILRSGAMGTGLPSISKPFLESFEIEVPSVEVQRKILEIQSLRNKEIEIKQHIDELREIEIQHSLLKAVKKEYNGK